MTESEYETFKATIDPWVREISPKYDDEDEHDYETRTRVTIAGIGDRWDSMRVMRGATTITRKDVEAYMKPSKSESIVDWGEEESS